MGRFAGKNDDSARRKAPPIWLILLLVGFVLGAFLFIGFRQLRGAQERRLHLLAGFGARVESTVADLSDRFVRIVRAPAPPETEQGNAPGPSGSSRPETATQRRPDEIERYLDHVPHVSLIASPPACPPSDSAVGAAGARRAQGSVGLSTAGAGVYLRYCPSAGRVGEPSEPPAGEAQQPEPVASTAPPRETAQTEALRGYLAEIDLEGLIEPMIIPGAFDSILLADERGQTLFQQGEPELRMLDLGPLVEAVTSSPNGGGVPEPLRALLDRSDRETVLDAVERWAAQGGARTLALGARTAMVKVEIAGSEYFVFLQPVALRLQTGAPSRQSGQDGQDESRPKRWVACGIISSENLLSAGLTTSPFLLFILVSILPLGIVTWPFLKLSLITRRQPFRRLDLAALVFATVLGISLAALLVFDLLFLVRLHGDVDDQLRDLSSAIEGRFRDELHDARSQLVQLNGRDQGQGSDHLFPSIEEDERLACRGEVAPDGKDNEAPKTLGNLAPVTFIKNQNNGPGADASARYILGPVDALIRGEGRGGVPLDLSTYPYFDSIFWVTPEGNHGCANLPLREHAVLPRNLVDRGYFRCARDCDPEPVFLAGAGGEPVDGVRFPKWAPDPEPAGAAEEGEGASDEVHAGCAPSFLKTAPAGSSPVCLQSFLDRTTGESVAALAIPGPTPSLPVVVGDLPEHVRPEGPQLRADLRLPESVPAVPRQPPGRGAGVLGLRFAALPALPLAVVEVPAAVPRHRVGDAGRRGGVRRRSRAQVAQLDRRLLAQSRQAQLYTQDAQVGFARALEARERDIPRRQGPLRDLYTAYAGDLKATRRGYLEAAFATDWGAEKATGDTVWTYARAGGGSPARFVDRLLSSRPFPLNDLSARPVQSDLSRFEAPRNRWERAGEDRIVLTHPRHHGEGVPVELTSTVPTLDVLPETLGIKTLGLLVGLLLLGMSPFLASELLAGRVLLIRLVGSPQPEGKEDRRRRISVASAPLSIILEGVRKTNDVVRQVVLVSTLPGPDAWGDQVADDRTSDAKDSDGTDDDGTPPFYRASFIDLWRQADSEVGGSSPAAGEGQGTLEPDEPSGDADADPAPQPAETDEPAEGDEPAADADAEPVLGSPRAQRFYELFARPEPSGQEEDDAGDATSSSRPAPILLTHFEPALDDPDAAADQVAVLRFLTHEDRRSVVILSETIPEPEMVPSEGPTSGDPRARRLWTKLLATYAVEHGHDATSDDLYSKRCLIDKHLEDIQKDLEPKGVWREELRTIRRNLEWVVRECSPTPVLRNIGRALLDTVEQTLPFLQMKMQRSPKDAERDGKPSRRVERAYKLFQLFTRQHMLAKVGSEARLHYRYLWSKCSPDEKLVLVQLARHGLVNPKYFGWVMDLMNRGLVVRDPTLRVMNESFGRFVRQEMQRSHILELQEEEGPSGWSVLKWILPAPLILVAAFLFVTQRDALSNLTGVLIAVVSLAPILVNLYGQFQEVNARRETKSGG